MAARPLFDALQRLPSDDRLRALERIIPLRVVQQVLHDTGHDRRRYTRLPAWFMVFFVLGLGLFCQDSYRQIFKWLQRFRTGGTPSRSTLAEARKGLGIAPLRLLARHVIRLRGTPDTPGAFYRGLRLMALDAFVLDVPDTVANARVFGRPRSGRDVGAFPQARVLSLCETGCHVLYRSLIKPYRRGESSMVGPLLRWLGEGMLLLWDRNFFSYAHLVAVRARKAHLLARIKSNLVFEPLEVLADGSFLAKAYRSPEHRARDEGGLLVRIIEYTLDDPARPTEARVHRLLTTLLDAALDPAEEVIVLYHERWEEELAIDELKTHQKGRPVLRSQTPAGVVQEIEGLLLAHYAVRAVMQEAAEQEGLDPQRLSFVGTLKVLRCRLPEVPACAAGRRRWWGDLIAEVGEEVLPERRDRVNPRVIRRKLSKWPKKRPQHRRTPQPTKTFREAIVIT
jgi:hypothetical protein